MVLSQIERRPAPRARVYHVEVLVNAGPAHVGMWAPLPRWFASEPEAWRAVEGFRESERALHGFARSYRVTEGGL